MQAKTAGENRDESADRAQIESVLREVGHGYLGITSADGWPGVVPVNFVYLDGRICFHGSVEGEKMEAMVRDPRVSFTVVDAASVTPSYFRNPHSACPATQYYRSVYVRGRARQVQGSEGRARILQALMEKLQPEGGHVPITADHELYKKVLRATAVTEIEIESMSGKFKLGQNLTDTSRKAVIDGLTERGTPCDLETVARMLASAKEPVSVQIP